MGLLSQAYPAGILGGRGDHISDEYCFHILVAATKTQGTLRAAMYCQDAQMESAAGAQTYQEVCALGFARIPRFARIARYQVFPEYNGLPAGLVPAGTSWYQLGPAGTSWDQLGPAGTSWDQLGPPGTS